jgi:hypothetical protein
LTVNLFVPIEKGKRLPNQGAVIKCPNGHERRVYGLGWQALKCYREGCDGKDILKSEYKMCTRITMSGAGE